MPENTTSQRVRKTIESWKFRASKMEMEAKLISERARELRSNISDLETIADSIEKDDPRRPQFVPFSKPPEIIDG